MNSIAEGQKKSDTVDKVREVKSKVFADFRPPVIRGQPRNLTPSTTSEAGTFSRSNSNVSGRQAVSTLPSRSNSTMSARVSR
jgi:hypothetical protein